MKKETTKVFSVRTDNELLKMFDEIISIKNENKNNVINELIQNYVSDNVPVKDHMTPIPIYENITRFGFDVQKFSEVDAQFLLDLIIQENKPHSFEIDYLNFLSKTFLHTGIKYMFNKLGITIYQTYLFTESNDSFGNPTIDLMRSTILYDFNKKDFKHIDDYDFIGVDLNSLQK